MSSCKSFNSKYIELGRQGLGTHYYCVYCGEELKSVEKWEDWDYHTYYYCDCEDAKKEIEIMKKIRELERQLPKEKYEAQPQVTKIEQ